MNETRAQWGKGVESLCVGKLPCRPLGVLEEPSSQIIANCVAKDRSRRFSLRNRFDGPSNYHHKLALFMIRSFEVIQDKRHVILHSRESSLVLQLGSGYLALDLRDMLPVCTTSVDRMERPTAKYVSAYVCADLSWI